MIAMLLSMHNSYAAEHLTVPKLEAAHLDAQHRVFQAILQDIVTTNGVDYSKLRKSHSTALNTYYVQLAQAPKPQQKAEQLAFYINAYNALTLYLVIQLRPTDPKAQQTWGVRNVHGFWKQYTFTVAGESKSLDDIEHHIIRPLGDPRVHFALNCASQSCPPLRAEPYTARKLEQQLQEQENLFLNSTYHLRLERNRLYVNPVLKWFAQDFEAHGGIRHYILTHSKRTKIQKHLREQGPISYWKYDWSLNNSTAK